MNASILIVSYNTSELTRACLDSVRRETREVDYEVVVVDNASRDDSVQSIRADFPEVTLIEAGANLGFGNAVNLAARHARGDHLLLLNPDTRVLDGAIDRLVRFAEENPRAGIYGGSTLDDHGEPDDRSCWRAPTPWSSVLRGIGVSALFARNRWLDPERIRLDPNGRAVEVDIVTGCFLLVRRDVWEHLDGFDPRYFMYSEDFDLCMRAKRLGYQPIVLPEARVVHAGGASEPLRAPKMIRLFLAKAQLFERHFGPTGAAIAKSSLAAWAGTRRIAHHAAAMLGRAESRATARCWDEIWAARERFLHPPSSLDTGRPASGAANRS